MKRIIVAIAVLLLCFQGLNAQNTFDEMFKEMERMQKEMMQQLEQMDLDGQGFQFFLDTMITHNFGDMEIDINERFFEDLDPAMFEGLFQQMEEQLSQIDEKDWAEIEQLFKGFEQILPIMPQQPENSEKAPHSKDKPSKKGEKKRKIYKM